MKINGLGSCVAMMAAAFTAATAQADVVSWVDTGKVVNSDFSISLDVSDNGWTSGGTGYNRSWTNPPYASGNIVGVVDTYGWGEFTSIQQDITGLALNTDHKVTLTAYEMQGTSTIEILAGGTQLATASIFSLASGTPTLQELSFNTGTASTVTIFIRTAGAPVVGGGWERAYLVLDDLTLAQAAVPEPAALGFLAIGASALLFRRK